MTVAMSAAKKPISSAVWTARHDPTEFVETVVVRTEQMRRAARPPSVTSGFEIV